MHQTKLKLGLKTRTVVAAAAVLGSVILIFLVGFTWLFVQRSDDAQDLVIPKEIAGMDLNSARKMAADLTSQIKKIEEKESRLFPSGPAILVDSAANQIYLIKGSSIEAKDKCSTGSGLELTDTNGQRTWTFDTPRGYFRALSKVTNPVWYRPDWAFIEEGEPIPKDRESRAVADVLGDYAIAFGDGYFIHGTLYTRMLGTSVTHGCIRVDDKTLKKYMIRLSRAPQSISFRQSEALFRSGEVSAKGGISLRCAATGLAAILMIGVFACACRNQGGSEQADAGNIIQLRKQVAELSLRQQVLAAEFSLAQNPAPYLVVDLSNHDIALRARGRTFRTFNVAEVDKRSVTGVLNDTWVVKEKKPFEKSERPKVLPGQGDAAAAEAAKKALWGPDRMPADYDLICDEDKTLEIRSLPSQQNSSRISRWGKSAFRRLAERYRRLKESPNAKSAVRIQLWLSEDDAKLLFWSLPKQMRALVVEGVSLPEAPSAIPPNTEVSSATSSKLDK